MNTVPSKPNCKITSTETLRGQVIELNKQGRDLTRAGKPEKAIAKFEEALRLDHENVITLNSYANALAKTQKPDRAIQLFERSLELDPNNVITLNSFANLLGQKGEINRAIQFFERSLQLNDCNIPTLNSFANLLVQKGESDRAIQLLECSLELDDRNVRTLNNVATFLTQKGENDRAAQLFERSLELDPNNVITLNSFANLLGQKGEINRAIQFFERSLQLNDCNIPTLNSFANLLVQKGESDRATQIFERSLELKLNDVITLNNFAKLLAHKGEINRAIQLFELALELKPNDVRMLNDFAILHQQNGDSNRAIQLFERSLQLEKDNIITLDIFANLLVKIGKIAYAVQLFERALELDRNDVRTLNSFANALMHNGENERAIQLFDRALDLDGNDAHTLKGYANALVQAGKFKELVALQPSDSYARLQYAKQLEGQKQYKDAVAQLLPIPLATQLSYHANIVRLHLGRLCYLLEQPDRGKQYIEDAIANSEDKDKSRLYAARSLLAVNSSSEEAIHLLQQIEESSLHYDEAKKAIALNADAQTSYELFAGGDEGFGNTEMLYRAMYHKIGNEVAILKSIAHRLLRKIEAEHPIVREIICDLEDLQDSVNRQRTSEKAEIANIPRDDYQQLIEVVSKTAHDIADEVNNILATIESKTRRVLRKLPQDSPLQENFEKLLAQLELTQTALNDLKSINEGMIIRRHRFPVRKLFEKWEPANWSNRPRIQRARVTFRLDNPDAEFDGDEEKIKSIINELVENSLKHNHDHRDLSIWMLAQDLLNPMDIGMPTVPGNRKYLYIQISDNGKGVPADKKEWIFQPLNTTSPEEKGSGLGLFIARKTLQKMGGYIRETGEVGRGSRFQLYIPYPTNEEI